MKTAPGIRREEELEIVKKDIKDRCEELISVVKKAERVKAFLHTGSSVHRIIVAPDKVAFDHGSSNDYYLFSYYPSSKKIDRPVGRLSWVEIQEDLTKARRLLKRNIKIFDKTIANAAKNNLTSRKVRKTRRVVYTGIAATVLAVAAAHFLGIKVQIGDNQITITQPFTTEQGIVK